MIKKTLALSLVATIILTFVGCGASTKEQFTLQPFTANVSIKANDLELAGVVEYAAPTQISFTVTKPENIAGIKIEEQSGEIKASCGDLAFTSSPFEKLTKDENVFKNLFEALGSLANAAFEIDTQGSNSLKGEYAFGSYNAIVDGATKRVMTVDTNGRLYVFSYDDAVG